MVAELGPASRIRHWQAGVRERAGELLQGGHLPALAGHANFIAGVIAAELPAVEDHRGEPQRHLPLERESLPRPPFISGDPDAGLLRLPDRSSGCPIALEERESRRRGVSERDRHRFCVPSLVDRDGRRDVHPRDDVVSSIWQRRVHRTSPHHRPPPWSLPRPVTKHRRFGGILRLWVRTRTGSGRDPLRQRDRCRLDRRPGSAGPTPARFTYVDMPSVGFTNTGSDDDEWVTCSAVGSGVVSTFLSVDANVEDFYNDSAAWSTGPRLRLHGLERLGCLERHVVRRPEGRSRDCERVVDQLDGVGSRRESRLDGA